MFDPFPLLFGVPRLFVAWVLPGYAFEGAVFLLAVAGAAG
jgi:hypothetical protein